MGNGIYLYEPPAWRAHVVLSDEVANLDAERVGEFLLARSDLRFLEVVFLTNLLSARSLLNR